MSITQRLAPPPEKDYAAAFYDLESYIHRVVRLARIADYLASLLQDDIENNRPGTREYLAKLTGDAAAEVLYAGDILDAAHLERFNDLVGRENAAAAPKGMKVRVVGEAQS